MGTPMAPNYANLFMASLEENIINQYPQKTKELIPLIWFRNIDDIFFIWTHDKNSLENFITFCNEYSMKNGMRSTINFETHISNDTVSFLDVEVHLMNGQLSTNLYTKPTDAHSYLNAKSSHPAYVTRNMPKG